MCVPFFRTPAHEQVFCQLYSIKAGCLLHFGVFAAVLTLEKLLERPLTACLHLNFVLVSTRHSFLFLL